MKPAGGIRTAKEAIQYLVVLYETLGPRWMTPERFRFGASSLLNDVLMQIEKQRTGRYQGPDHFSLDWSGRAARVRREPRRSDSTAGIRRSDRPGERIRRVRASGPDRSHR